MVRGRFFLTMVNRSRSGFSSWNLNICHDWFADFFVDFLHHIACGIRSYNYVDGKLVAVIN